MKREKICNFGNFMMTYCFLESITAVTILSVIFSYEMVFELINDLHL